MPLTTAVLLAALAAAPGGADCTADAKNLLAKKDCGFTTGVAGWTARPDAGTVSHDPRDGAPKPGALKVTAGAQASVNVSGPCLPAKPGATYQFGSRYRLASGEVYVCALDVYQYKDAACTDSTGKPSAISDLAAKEWQAFDAKRRPEWKPGADTVTVAADARFLQVSIGCSGPGPFTALFDDVFLREQ
jgi:hypothetical protein